MKFGLCRYGRFTFFTMYMYLALVDSVVATPSWLKANLFKAKGLPFKCTHVLCICT